MPWSTEKMQWSWKIFLLTLKELGKCIAREIHKQTKLPQNSSRIVTLKYLKEYTRNTDYFIVLSETHSHAQVFTKRLLNPLHSLFTTNDSAEILTIIFRFQFQHQFFGGAMVSIEDVATKFINQEGKKLYTKSIPL